jgi:hypothetical protein
MNGFHPLKESSKNRYLSYHAEQELTEIIHIKFLSVGKSLEESLAAIVTQSIKIAADA